jgi:hypothetical protein
MDSGSADKVRFKFELFRCRTDVYALRWENRRDGRSGWMPIGKGGDGTAGACQIKDLHLRVGHAVEIP